MTTSVIRTVPLPPGEEIPALGQGTWYLGEDPGRRDQEIAALRMGLDLLAWPSSTRRRCTGTAPLRNSSGKPSTGAVRRE